jgi:DNA-binding LacI/PurR family transcriptional regulator
MDQRAQRPIVSRPPTGSDVARAAGVSKSAVSRAFTGGIVSAEARERIFTAARALRYRPSLTARSLTTSQSKLIGVAVTHLDNQFYPDVIQRLSERLGAAGFRIVLFVTRGDADLEPMLDELLGYRLDGVVLASSSMAAEVAAECLAIGVPVTMFNNVDPDGHVPGVCADNAHGAALVAQFLLVGGHRRCAVITGLAESTTSVERSEAFAAALVAGGGDAPRAVPGAFSFDGATRAARELLLGRDPPDALFCVNDHMALAALQAARSVGREPGTDISIIGFDNVAIGAWPAFSLTTCAQPVEAMIEQTVARLLKGIAGHTLPHDTLRLPVRLLVRDSARRPPDVKVDSDGCAYWEP